MAQPVRDPTSKDAGSIPGLTQWVKDQVLVKTVVWFADVAWIPYFAVAVGWASAVTPIQHVARELPHAAGEAVKKTAAEREKSCCYPKT